MSATTATDELLHVLETRVLGSGMGASFFSWTKRRTGALSQIAAWLAGYAALWALVSRFPGSGQPELVSLLAWGAFYFSGAVYVAQTATKAVIRTVAEDIVPYASSRFVANVTADLKARYSPGWSLRRALPAAVIAIGLALWALSVDLKYPLANVDSYTAELWFWASTYFLYFLTAGMSADASRFYMHFANHLEEERESFYVLGAADTPLVRGIAKLANQVLAFMAGIFLFLASGLLLAVVPPEPFALPARSWLLLTMVPASCFFSLGLGTIVYIGTELRIREILHRFALEEADNLRRNSQALLHSNGMRSPANYEAIDGFLKLHDRILAGGRFGSRLGATISVALPLLVPLLSVVVGLYLELNAGEGR